MSHKPTQAFIIIQNVLVLKETETTFSCYNTDVLFNVNWTYLERYFSKENFDLDLFKEKFVEAISLHKRKEEVEEYMNCEILMYKHPSDYVIKDILDQTRILMWLDSLQITDQLNILSELPEQLNNFDTLEIDEHYLTIQEKVDLNSLLKDPEIDQYVKDSILEVQKLQEMWQSLHQMNKLQREEKIQAKKSFLENLTSWLAKFWRVSLAAWLVLTIWGTIFASNVPTAQAKSKSSTKSSSSSSYSKSSSSSSSSTSSSSSSSSSFSSNKSSSSSSDLWSFAAWYVVGSTTSSTSSREKYRVTEVKFTEAAQSLFPWRSIVWFQGQKSWDFYETQKDVLIWSQDFFLVKSQWEDITFTYTTKSWTEYTESLSNFWFDGNKVRVELDNWQIITFFSQHSPDIVDKVVQKQTDVQKIDITDFQFKYEWGDYNLDNTQWVTIQKWATHVNHKTLKTHDYNRETWEIVKELSRTDITQIYNDNETYWLNFDNLTTVEVEMKDDVIATVNGKNLEVWDSITVWYNNTAIQFKLVWKYHFLLNIIWNIILNVLKTLGITAVLAMVIYPHIKEYFEGKITEDKKRYESFLSKIQNSKVSKYYREMYNKQSFIKNWEVNKETVEQVTKELVKELQQVNNPNKLS